MAWGSTRTTTLIMAAMIGEAFAVEYLRSLPGDARAAAAARIRTRFLASIDEYRGQKIASGDPKDTIAHQMMGDEMARGADAAFAALVDLAAQEG
jgi:hypothetical protein